MVTLHKQIVLSLFLIQTRGKKISRIPENELEIFFVVASEKQLFCTISVTHISLLPHRCLTCKSFFTSFGHIDCVNNPKISHTSLLYRSQERVLLWIKQLPFLLQQSYFLPKLSRVTKDYFQKRYPFLISCYFDAQQSYTSQVP